MRIGLGTALLQMLLVRARAAGISRMTGVINPENRAIRELLKKVAGSYESRFAGPGAVEIAVDLTDEDEPSTVSVSENPN
jgi:predicted acetyltransferase